MALRFIFFFIGIIFLGCRVPKCQSYCERVGIVPVAVGYTSNELDTVVLNAYAPNGLFDSLLTSYLITPYQFNWVNTITTSDTLINTDFNPGTSVIYSNYDLEIIIPLNNNKVYRFSKITFGGPTFEDVGCASHGSNPSCSHAQYLSSYVLNGAIINFNPPNSKGYLFFHK